MKKFLSLLSLAALTIGLLGSCAKIEERIDNLEKRVDGIESTSIASVQQQIDGIKTSINDLKAADVTINGQIDELKTAAEAQQTLIDALKEADNALWQKDTELEGRIATLEGQVATIGGQIETLVNADKAINTRIDTLSTYVDTQIGNTKDWAEETFATLDQYQQTADDLAALSVTVTGISTTLAGVQTSISGLDTKIDGIDTALQEKITDAKTELEGKITSLKTELEGKIADAISASETSIKSWINELLEGYYTAAQVDAKITGLNTAIDAAKGTAKYRIDSLATELTALKTAVDTAKAAIRTEYKNAIDVAITKLDGEIRGALKDSILAVNGRIAALDTRVTTLEGKVLNLEGNVNKLLAMIQSVSITPAYSDGSVEAENGILTLKCIVRPAEALTGMQSLKDSLLIYADLVKVKTKAATSAYMEIKVSEASVLDAAQGAITLTADISNYLPKGADKALTVALNIKNGISDFTTEFVPVYVAPTADYVEIGGVKWGTKNLGATTVAGSLATCAGDYYAWGETEPYYGTLAWNGTSGTFSDWKTEKENGYAMQSYCGISVFSEWSTPPYDNDTKILKAKYDAATAELGDGWRMPTSQEFKDLAEACGGTDNYDRTTYASPAICGESTTFSKGIYWCANYDGVAGVLFCDGTNKVFFPAAGAGNSGTLGSVGFTAYYWSSSLSTSNTSSAYRLSCTSSKVTPQSNANRYFGFSVRPVSTEGVGPAPAVPVTGVTLNKTELRLKVGKTETLTANVLPAEATNQNVIWSSDNTGVATVGSTDGKVTAFAEGTATITAIVDGLFTATCAVTVNNLPDGALAGKFTVNADGKQVHFSKGNLVATISSSGTPTAWKFAANQYDCIGGGGANTTISSRGGDIDLFGWSTTKTNYGISLSVQESDYSGDFVDWGTAIDDDNTWYTLSNDECKYLFWTRTASTVSSTANARYAKATVNNIQGLILLPDTYAHPEGVTALTNINTKNVDFTVNNYTSTVWAKMEAAGAVFLPVTGIRTGGSVGGTDSGYYWLSTTANNGEVYREYFNQYYVSDGSSARPLYGQSVRLVTVAE